ncbi:MAG: SDR family NAD(P)-dependent oxidoreductase [Bacteroidetes bacterium]|nr:SDR family NAD(P)-dependent oxidoreductase [Bacteroidota bacterium]
MNTNKESMKKTVLITGSNKGIGFETSRQLGHKGFHVIISGRDQLKIKKALEKLQEEGIEANMLLMDVSNHENILQASNEFKKLNISLDVLINNAAILLKEDRSLITNSPSIIENTIQTNSFSIINVTREFLQFIPNGGRIINMSSGGGSMTDPVGGWSPAYCVSKTTINAITRQLSFELLSKNISVNSVCPGWVKTDMGGQGAMRPVEKGAETPVWLASEAPQSLSGKFFRDKKEIPW